MILNKISDKTNSKLIAQKYADIINSGVSSSEILVLTFNGISKKNIVENILNLTKNNILSNIKIFTFNGLIHNSILENWAFIENNLSDTNTSILPNLLGLEITQYILKQILKNKDVKGYNSKKSLLHQIFKRYQIIVYNDLSEDEIEKKSKILKESFAEDASQIIQEYKAKTISLRSFDNLRQCQIFKYLYTKTTTFNNIKYLLVEDADECTPLIIDFIKTISPNLKDHLIILDKNGGSRCGYLGADLNASQKFENIFNEKIIDKYNDSENIQNLIKNITNNEKNIIKNLSVQSLSKRLDMMDFAVNTVKQLLDNNIFPSDISIITPIQDKMLKFTFLENFKDDNVQFLTGSEKLNDNPLVKATLTVLKLSISKQIEEYELRTILSKYLGIPIKNCKKIFSEYKKNNELIPTDLGIYTDIFKNFCTTLNKIKQSNTTLSEKAYYTYSNVFKTANKNDLTKFNFFLKELKDFEKAFKTTKNIEDDIITQIENSIISENPYSSKDIEKDKIIISTPQKIIDNKVKTKYQIWLDTSSLEWVKTDIGPLYNAWVFQKDWNKNDYTIEDNIKLSNKKTAKILRKLMLNTENIIAISSLFDTQGAENFGGIETYLIPEKQEKIITKKPKFHIIPRDDQKPVLEYKKEQMAISAVPGAGKTTILLALILKLLEKGINPENIYVLTYMESAARNFKDRIKSVNPNSSKLPNISTIHGLALRILKENSNFERIGLNPDFEICDDTQRGRIIKSLSKNLSKQDAEEFDRAISVLKLSGAELNIEKNPQISHLIKLNKGSYNDMKLSRFLKFFYNYQNLLAQNNLIDYDDILTSAVRLLEENNDILKYYQNICEYIIEDEAQDSSSIQQKLINLLSNKYKNLIRCGDINQAITTTFTNADTEGFKRFIENSQRVDMNCSQRCSKGVWELANSLVKFGNSKLKEPFYEIYMQPVEGRNPVEEKPLFSNIYENIQEEKIQITKTIKSLLKEKPNCTIGILLRNNYQVNSWANYINDSGLNAITRNECLAQKTIFKVIFSILKLIENPFDNKVCANTYKSMAECGFYKLHLDKIIENYETDFISLDNDNIQDQDLARFHWDMNYWLSYPELTIDELALKIGMNYFSEEIAKSNIYLISTLCAKLNNNGFASTIQRLEELSNRPSLSGFKFFSEDEEDKTNGKIQIMTLHKSKGDEFDYVFLPEMSEKNLTLDISKLDLKKSSNFMENVRALNNNYSTKTENELKTFLVSENYRLLYVAITRAKQRLYISTHKKETYYGKTKDSQPSIIFDELL